MPQVIILGFSFSFPAPYHEGHVCTVAEAETLNRVMLRGGSKGLHKAIVAERERGGIEADVLKVGRDYISDYAITFSQGYERLRAIEVEAKRIAESAISERLYAQGKTPGDIGKAAYESLVIDLSTSEAVRNEASKRVDAVRKIAQDVHSDLSRALIDEED